MIRPFILALLVPAILHGAEGLPPDPERDAEQIVDSFYNLEFDHALTDAKDLEARYPGYPGGPFYRAVIAYQRMRVGVTTPDTAQQFTDAVQQTYALAEAWASTSPVVSHFYLGAALGFQARGLAADHHYAAAIPKARRGVKHLREALKLDPAWEDAYLGVGMYDYFMARIPVAAKPFAYLAMGDWGNRDRGLKALKRAAESGRAAKMEARSLLAMIYLRKKEQNWEESARLLGPLMDRYPRNPRYRLALIYVLERQHQWDAAAELAGSPTAPWIDLLEPTLQPRVRENVQLRLEEIAARAPVAAFKWPLSTGPE